jgi:hypothetical protein
MSDAAAQISKGLAAAEATHSAMSEHSSVNQFSNSSTTSDQTSYTEQSTYTAPDGTVITESYQSRTMTDAERSEASAQISQGLASAEAAQAILTDINEFHGEAGGIRDTAVGGSTSTSNGSSVSESSTGYESEAGAMQVGEVAKSMEEFKAMFPELDKSMTVADFAEAVSPETAQRLEAEGVSKDFVSGMISQVNDVIPGEHAATDAEVFTFNAVNTAWGEQGGSYEDVVDFANKELSAVLENTSAFVQTDPDADVDMESESEAELGAE